MIRALGHELLTEKLLNPDDAVVVGVSGGADSMALLHILVDLNRTLGWRLRLTVAHLDHQLRGAESEQDAAFIQAAADGLGLPAVIESRDVAQRAQEQSLGIEEVARRERYAFFERVCLRVGARIVALGHHADDQAETVLYRILRGTGLSGLAGMPRGRPLSPGSDIRVIRPLLRRDRASLRKYLAENGITHREDCTNVSNEPMRNRIRNLVLPALEAEVNPQVREALTRLAEQAHWVNLFIRETVEKTFETLIVSHTDQVLVLNADALARKSRILQAELIRMAYRSFGLGEQDMTFGHLVSVVDLAGEPVSGKQVRLPGGMTVEKRYHQLTFSLPSTEARETTAPEITVRVPGMTVLPGHKLEIVCSIESAAAEDIPRLRRSGRKMEEFVDFDAVRPPLVVRQRRAGDRVFPLGAPGSKKLSDFLADLRVAPAERDRVALLCDQLGPIWVIGHRIDDRVKLTALTRNVLHLQARAIP
jgi:tRNA(Ile)-lysidine synthase